MSTEIDIERRQRALQPSTQDNTPRPGRLVQAVRLLVCVTATAGVGCLVAAFCLDEWRTALAGSTLLVISAIAGAVWVINGLLAERNRFYQRGFLDGWMRGWRGQEPSTDDPLLRS